MKLIVGCPLTNRAWILPHWFEHNDRAFNKAGIQPLYYLLVGTSEDNTEEVLQRYAPPGTLYLSQDEEETIGGKRYWNQSRYDYMAYLRNRLLEDIRRLHPTYYLSLDSDILLHEDAITNLLETAEGLDGAVGGKCYMQVPPSRRCPSWANLTKQGTLRREDSEGIISPDALMGIKLMSPKAYNQDYCAHPQGEDIGWSLNCKRAGVPFRWDGRIANKHVMSKRWLDQVDPRVGW